MPLRSIVQSQERYQSIFGCPQREPSEVDQNQTEIADEEPAVLLLLEAFSEEAHMLFKEVVETLALPTRSTFGGGIPHRLLPRVSLAKSTSAPARC